MRDVLHHCWDLGRLSPRWPNNSPGLTGFGGPNARIFPLLFLMIRFTFLFSTADLSKISNGWMSEWYFPYYIILIAVSGAFCMRTSELTLT